MAEFSVSTAGPGSGSATIRLAELVAALSLGVDLGFGQPMEHVLRQCMIALRLAERAGLGRGRAVGRLLHGPAGQRRLSLRRARAGEVVRRRHRAQVRQVRPRAAEPRRGALAIDAAASAAATRRCTGSGSAWSSPLSGHRDLDGMIAQHSALARSAGRAARSVRGGAGGGRCRLRAVGRRGLARASCAATRSRSASRLAQIGEFTEVAHRIGGVGAAVALAAQAAPARSSTRICAAISAEHAEGILDGLDARRDLGRGHRGRAGAGPDLSRRAVRRRAAGHRRLRRPEVALHARSRPRRSPSWPRAAGASARAEPRTRWRSCAGPAWCSGLGRLGVSNAIWDKRGPLGAGEWERVRMHPYLTERMLHQSELAGAARRARGAAARAAGRLGLSAGPVGPAIPLSARVLGAADAYQSMCEPRPYRDAPRPTGPPPRAARRGARRAGWTATRSRRCWRRPAIASARRREGPAGLTAREVDVLRLVSRGLSSKEIAAPAGHLTQDGPQPHRAHLHQDRRLEPGGRQPVRGAARPAARED